MKCAFDVLTDTRDISRASHRARRASVPRDPGDASARHGDAIASCEAMRVASAARAFVPAEALRREASGVLGTRLRANASLGKKMPRSDAKIQLALRKIRGVLGL